MEDERRGNQPPSYNKPANNARRDNGGGDLFRLDSEAAVFTLVLLIIHLMNGTREWWTPAHVEFTPGTNGLERDTDKMHTGVQFWSGGSYCCWVGF